MGLFGKLERRHMACDGSSTTIALEPEFWSAADRHAEAAGITWREWAADRLAGKPEDQGRASWLRVTILKAAGSYQAGYQ